MHIRFIITVSAALTSLAMPLLAQPEIKLSGRKDMVLTIESRATVLDVAGRYLSEKDGEFLVQIDESDSPFVFEQPVEVVERDEEEAAPEVVQYSDASVLQAVAGNFAKQVRGTMARGSISFLQLKGGSMVKPGTSFPVSLPQVGDQSFTITISEITPDGYTLKLGDATQTISLTSGSSSGGVQRN